MLGPRRRSFTCVSAILTVQVLGRVLVQLSFVVLYPFKKNVVCFIFYNKNNTFNLVEQFRLQIKRKLVLV